jgi:peptide/nickel transport system ATP-binding protein
MIFQDPYASLNPRWRAFDSIAEPLRTHRIGNSRRAVRERIAQMLELVGLTAQDGRKFPHQFSGGQQQRISIARALSIEPALIIADEPTSALDVSVQAQILNLMRDLQERLGLTYLFISHNLAVVSNMANTTGVLYLGRLVEVGPTAYLLSRPRHPYTRLLVDAVPDIAAIDKNRRAVKGETPDPANAPPGCPFSSTLFPRHRSMQDGAAGAACSRRCSGGMSSGRGYVHYQGRSRPGARLRAAHLERRI